MQCTEEHWRDHGECQNQARGWHAGEEEIPGLTDDNKPKMRGPKRASKIRKLYNLTKEDDVRSAVKLHARKIEKGGKTITKCPKIQRLVTPATLQRKRRRAALKKKAITKVRVPARLLCMQLGIICVDSLRRSYA